MLILTRKEGESFLLELPGGETVEIKVAELAAGQVRLGVTAPDHCKIWRSELYQTVQANRQAAGSAPGLKSLAAKLAGGERGAGGTGR